MRFFFTVLQNFRKIENFIKYINEKKIRLLFIIIDEILDELLAKYIHTSSNDEIHRLC